MVYQASSKNGCDGPKKACRHMVRLTFSSTRLCTRKRVFLTSWPSVNNVPWSFLALYMEDVGKADDFLGYIELTFDKIYPQGSWFSSLPNNKM